MLIIEVVVEVLLLNDASALGGIDPANMLKYFNVGVDDDE
jgi:hypothetical protein